MWVWGGWGFCFVLGGQCDDLAGLAAAQKDHAALQSEFAKKEKADLALARSIDKNMSRQEHRAAMRAKDLGVTSAETADGSSAVERAQARWNDPRSFIEDVAEGIAISVYLPDLVDVKLAIDERRSQVRVEA